MTLQLALLGKMRTGKDTLGAYAIDRYECTRFAFGEPLKHHAAQLFPDRFEQGNKPRKLLQDFGQKMREIDPEIWVKMTLSSIDEFRKTGGTNIILTDVRQPNEVRALRERGFVFIRIQCAEPVRLERIAQSGDSFTTAELTHETESHIDTYPADYEVFNEGSLTHTYVQFDTILRELRE